MNSRVFRYLVLSSLFLVGVTFQGLPVMGMSADSAAGVRISGLFPPDLATDVAVSSPLTIEFSGPGVGQSFYQTIQVALFQGSRPINGEMFYNPATRQVMFKPGTPLNNGQTYTAQLTFRDAQGNPAEKVWNFRTSGGAVAPTQQSFTSLTPQPPVSNAFSVPPTSGQANAGPLKIARASMSQGSIPSHQPLEISFSEPLDLTTLKDAPIKLYQGKLQQGVDYKLSKDLRTVSIVPRNTLNSGEGYNVVVHQQLTGSSGARLPKSVLIPFRVQSATNNDEQAVPDFVVEEAPPDDEPVDSFYSAPVARPQQSRSPNRAPDASFLDLPQTLPTNTPLKVVGLTPRHGDIIQNNNQPISVAFNNEVRAETLNEFTFRLEDDFGPVPARIKYFQGKKQAVLTPIGVLDGSKTYRIILTQGVTDPYGQTIQTPLNTTFSVASSQARRQSIQAPVVNAGTRAPTTRNQTPAPRVANAGRSMAVTAPQDFFRDSQELEGLGDDSGFADYEENAYQPPAPPTRPTVTRQAQATRAPARTGNTSGGARPQKLSAFRIQAITPTSNAKAVPRDSHIIIRFSEPADPETVDAINISVFGNQRRVEGHVTYNRQNRQAVFTPKDRLNAETEYTIVINDKIKSVGGETLVGRYTWQFLTSADIRTRYSLSQPVSRTDNSFSIPLIDRKKTQVVPTAKTSTEAPGQSSSFTYLAANHWVFKTIRHIAGKGLLTTYPFNHNTKVSRYECAMSVKLALDNLKTMANTPGKPKLRLADLVHLENLVVEFRPELRSLRTDTGWFETFLQEQGVNITEIEHKVQGMNRG